MTDQATQDAPTDAQPRPAVAGQVERSVSRQLAALPRPYYEEETVTLYHGDALALLPLLPKADAVVTDPPYGETSLDWDVWPDGWPDAAALVAPQVWCFGSTRMFLDKGHQFRAWKLAQDVVWEKHNGSGFAADRFKRVHELAVHWYWGPWSDLAVEPQFVAEATARQVRRKARPAHTGQIGEHRYRSEDGGPKMQRSVIFARSCHGYATNETQKPEAIVAPLVRYSTSGGGGSWWIASPGPAPRWPSPSRSVVVRSGSRCVSPSAKPRPSACRKAS